jgi:DNA-binding response OmpR family regulator
MCARPSGYADSIASRWKSAAGNQPVRTRTRLTRRPRRAEATKPFSSAELVSRIRAILRRRDLDRQPTSESEIRVGRLVIDLTRHMVQVDGRNVDLTPSEFRLLLLLAREPERVFTRTQIMEHLWQTPYVGGTRACDAHVSNLRRKVERDPNYPERIVTVRETGYKLVPV